MWSAVVFLALPCAGSLPPSERSKAPSICVRWAPAAGVQGASHPLPLLGGGSSLTGRCAVRPVGVAARRRAPTAVNNGAGREEKGNLLGEAVRPAGGRAGERASERGSEGGESSLLPRCQRDAAAAGAGEGAPRERIGQLREAGRGQPEVGSERARGARSPRAWPARETTGGAPREGPRSSAGCRTKSCRRCNGPATAVSVRVPADLGAPLSLGRRWEGRGA